MKIIQIDDVELISIKTKSLQDLDNEMRVNFNSNISDYTCGKESNETAHKKDFKFSNYPKQQKEEQEKEIDDDHYKSSVRYVAINKSPNGACGFHLTRTKWDPYPWISAVDRFTPAANSDLKAGDCVLEVNGCDVLGLRITEIAKLVKSSQHQVTLLLWSSSCNTQCDEESLCAAPMPRSLQRLSLVVQTVLSLIECPVCLDTITPPAMQCQNGHLLCVNCRIRAEKCPVCRDRYFPRPALIAEQIQSAITSAFNLCRNEDKVRQKIFGRHNRQRQMVKATLDSLLQKQTQTQQQQHHQFLKADTPSVDETAAVLRTASTASSAAKTIDSKCDRKATDKFFKCDRSSSNGSKTTCNKFLTKLLNSKAYSMENLLVTNGAHNNDATKTIATETDNIFNSCHKTITSAISQLEMFEMQQQQQQQQQNNSHKRVGDDRTALFKDFTPTQQQQQKQHQQTPVVTNTNQFNDLPLRRIARNHQYLLTYKPNLNSMENDLNINSKLCCMQMSNTKLKHFSLSSDRDSTRTKETITCLLESPHHIFVKNPVVDQVVCETSYATIPRAIKLKEKHYKQHTTLYQNDVHVVKETATNLLKLHSSSMTSLDLSLSWSSA